MIEIIPVSDKNLFKEFLAFPFKLYARYPLWVTPLLKDIRAQFSPRNPFFKHGEVASFIAKSDGDTVGRITAIYNSAHINFWEEQAGFFGFFECIDNLAVASALIEEAKQWLRKKGMVLLRGPMNFSTNEECGLLIDGYDSPPMIMMPYNPSYYHRLFEGCGLRKAKDLFAYTIDVPETLPEKILRVGKIAQRHNIKVRHIDIKSFRQEVNVFKNIYNSAWQRNWGFVPMTEEEIEYVSRKLKPIIIPELALIAECKGEPVGFVLVLPDFNYVLKKVGGRLFPFGIFKALWYSGKTKDLRIMLLGIKEGYRKQGIDALFTIEGFKAIKRMGYKRVEFSWVLEDNTPVQRLIEVIGGKLYKTYRIYETEI